MSLEHPCLSATRSLFFPTIGGCHYRRGAARLLYCETSRTVRPARPSTTQRGLVLTVPTGGRLVLTVPTGGRRVLTVPTGGRTVPLAIAKRAWFWNGTMARTIAASIGPCWQRPQTLACTRAAQTTQTRARVCGQVPMQMYTFGKPARIPPPFTNDI